MKKNNDIKNIGVNLFCSSITIKYLLGALKPLVKNHRMMTASVGIILFSCPWAVQSAWVTEDYNTFNTNNPINFVYEGGLTSQLTGSAYNGVDAWAANSPRTAYMMRVVYDGGAVTWAGNDPVSDITTGECYLSTYSTIFGLNSRETGYQFSDTTFRSDNVTPDTSGFVGNEWIKINRPCAEVRPNAPDFPQLLPLSAFTGYILTGKNIMLFKYQSGTHHVTDVDRVYIVIDGLACPQPRFSTKCGRTRALSSGKQPVIPTPKKSCNIVMPREINYVDLSKSNYLGSKVDENIQVFCTEPSSIKFILPDTVNVGPFKLNVMVDDVKNPTVSVDNQANLKLSTEIISAEGELNPGEYTGSIVVVTSLM